jgi:flavin-dependent dehydrogenase
MNRGVFDSRVHPNFSLADLKKSFDAMLATRKVELDDVRLHGHPERWYDPTVKHSAPRVLLAGDAAGTEPLLGEGISHALDFGMRAANEAMRAFRRNDFSFADYERRIAFSAFGRRVVFKGFLANILYDPPPQWLCRLGFNVLRIILG